MNPFINLGDLFRRRKDPSKTPDDFSIPFGLTPAEFRAIKDLRGSEGLAAWRKALDQVVKLSGEQLLQASKDESLHFHRGVIMGIRKSLTLVDEISRAEETFLDDKRRREQSTESRRAKRGSTTFGTLWHTAGVGSETRSGS